MGSGRIIGGVGLLGGVLLVLLMGACRKEKDWVERGVSFTVDTVRFDSVFEGHTSITQRLALRNGTKEPLRVGVPLWQGHDESDFHWLVDGRLPHEFQGTTILPGDSIMLLVRVRPEALSNDSVTLLLDSVGFPCGERTEWLYFYAKGLRVHTVQKLRIAKDITFAPLPALWIEDTIEVLHGATLTLPAGCALYFAPSAGIKVLGSLRVEGTVEHPVVLAGHRLETYYRRRPGQWEGVHLCKGSGVHSFAHMELRGAVHGLRIDTVGTEAEPVVIHNSIIHHNSVNGITLQESYCKIRGSILGQNFRHAICMSGKGRVWLQHGTLYGETNLPDARSGALIKIESVQGGQAPYMCAYNSIVWGDRGEEVLVVMADDDAPATRWLEAEHCIMRLSASLRDELSLGSTVWDENPCLCDPLHEDYGLKRESPARERGAWNWISFCETDRLGGKRQLPHLQRADLGALIYREP